jgi:hypothetical protein
MIEAHNLTHVPYADWCEICVAAKGISDQHRIAENRKVMCQIDYHYVGASGDRAAEAGSKATLLTMVEVDSGDVDQTVVKTKGEYPFAVRFLANFLDRQQEGVIHLRFDPEPSLAALAAKVEKFRAPKITMLEDTARAEHSQIGAVERAHRTCDSQLRALRLDVRGRTGEDVIPGHVMFPWMVRYGPFCLNRFQPRGQRGQTILRAETDITTSLLWFLSLSKS